MTMKFSKHTAHETAKPHGFIAYWPLFIVSSLLLLLSCARIGTPDGGPYDETPPKVVRTSPKYGSAHVKDVKKVTIEFDEIIKVDNAMEKVVISPPQIEQPEIEAIGKKVTITLLDSLKPNMTYTIDFADAIVDNNEGNPYGDYAFTFSTGEQVDSFQVSGHVLEASNLEPIKGMLVGLYKLESSNNEVDSLPDSIFRTKPFERISRTDSRGHFIIKGLSAGDYRVFALNDQNQNYIYDQRAEKVAFSKRILSTSSKLDLRPDTIWHDSIHYDSIVMTPYTHYYPDDIVLMAFEPSAQDRYLLKNERPTLQQFTLFFTAPSDTLPKLTGLNFDATDAFVIDANEHKDTIDYWIRDSLIYNLDTLEIQLDYFATDTTGNLAIRTDTLTMVPKLTKAKLAKQQKEKWEEWADEYREKVKEEQRAARKAQKGAGEAVEKKSKKKKKEEEEELEIPPMPEEFMEFKTSNMQGLDPDKNIDLFFNEPIASFDPSKVHFSILVDTLYVPTKCLIRQVPNKPRHYRLYAEWETDSSYQIKLDTAAFVNIYGMRSGEQIRNIRMKALNSYSTLFVTLQGSYPSAYIQLIDGSDKVVKTLKATNGRADFYFITPGTYYLRMFEDTNGNGMWDTGDYDQQLQPEQVYYYPDPLTLKAQWEISQTWNPASTPIPMQKPGKITKQKPEKAKSVRNRNATRKSNKK